MIDHLEAIKAHLAPLDYSTHLFEAVLTTDEVLPPMPYLVLGAAAGLGFAPDEMPTCGESDEIEFVLRVTAVGVDVTAPPKVQRLVRARLSPGYRPIVIPMDDRLLTAQYLRTEVASAVDRDHTAANSNRHPAYGVDAYQITSQPT